jgi:CRISPR-associated protein (TIGR03986 family)
MNSRKHINPIREDRCAFAPYNFVELPDRIVTVPKKDSLPNHDSYYRLTGRIECTLTTESPLYIRAGLTPSAYADWGEKSHEDLTTEQKRIKAQFFSIANDQPILPGSSLRGMLRSIVEIITYSKLSKVSDRSLVYRAVAETSILKSDYHHRINQGEGRQAGFMTYSGGTWRIKPALPISGSSTRLARIRISELIHNLPKWHQSKNAFKINIDIRSLHSDHDNNEYKYPLATRGKVDTSKPIKPNAVLVKSGAMPNKKKECIFGLPDETKSNWIDISDDLIFDYKNQITKGQILHLGEGGVLKENQPVFYLMDGDKLVFFGHAMMFRLPYDHSIGEFMPAGSGQEEGWDVSEILFGTVRDQKAKKGEQQSISGRVNVNDAYCCHQNGDIWLSGDNHIITPKILSSPKPTTFQHYLVQTDPLPQKLKHFNSSPVNETVIRGQKLYWHKGDVTIEAITEINKPTTQNTQIKPIKSGIDFKFNIEFQNLQDYELGALLWVLDISSHPEYRLSLGMGKPLGMGAVKISHRLYQSNRQQRYQELFSNDKNHWGVAEEFLDSAVYIAAFEAWMLEQLPKNREYQEFKKIPRIETLLTMLRWNENISAEERQQTNYMSLEDFRSRKILPVPQQVRRKIEQKRPKHSRKDI